LLIVNERQHSVDVGHNDFFENVPFDIM
jgi:hypothetical protein